MSKDKPVSTTKASKDLIAEYIKKTQADIYLSELKERFWLRRVIAGKEARQAEQMAGLMQADQRKLKDWLAFLEEVEKESQNKE